MAELRSSALWRLLLTRPELLANHASAYGALIEEQASLKFAGWRRTAIRQLLVYVALGVACISVEVAAMLWAVSSTISTAGVVTLVVSPSLPLLVAAWFSRKEADVSAPTLSEILRAQVQADWAVLQEPPR